MSRSLDIGPYEGRSDRPIWFVAAVITAILAGLAIQTASTSPFTFLTSGRTDAPRFGALRNITDFGTSTAGNISALTWTFWVRLPLLIAGFPPASSPTAASYLRTIGRIDQEVGLNLAS